MKFLLILLISISSAFADEMKTEIYETKNGYGFHFYHLALPGEGSPLWNFISQMKLPHEWNTPCVSKRFTSTDKSFSFVCKQMQATKDVFESSCEFFSTTGILDKRALTIRLEGRTADEFMEIFRDDSFEERLNSHLRIHTYSNFIELTVTK